MPFLEYNFFLECIDQIIWAVIQRVDDYINYLGKIRRWFNDLLKPIRVKCIQIESVELSGVSTYTIVICMPNHWTI